MKIYGGIRETIQKCFNSDCRRGKRNTIPNGYTLALEIPAKSSSGKKSVCFLCKKELSTVKRIK